MSDRYFESRDPAEARGPQLARVKAQMAVFSLTDTPLKTPHPDAKAVTGADFESALVGVNYDNLFPASASPAENALGMTAHKKQPPFQIIPGMGS